MTVGKFMVSAYNDFREHVHDDLPLLYKRVRTDRVTG